MSIYCGTDIVEVERIKLAINNNAKFKTSIFSKREIEEIELVSNDSIKYQRYAGRFASKEAIYKALSKILIEEKLYISFLDVEILNDENFRERPYVNIINKKLRDMAIDKQIKIDLSISHVKDNAIAMVIVYIEKE